jgi:hypothetical protein
MNCEQFRRLIYLGDDVHLSAEEERLLGAHLRECNVCAKEKMAADKTAVFIRTSARGSYSPDDPEGLTSRILEVTARAARPVREGRMVSLRVRFLDFLTTPLFRYSYAASIALIMLFFLTQSYFILADVRDLEVQQHHRDGAMAVPRLNYAIDVRPLRGTPEGTLLDRIEGLPTGDYLVVNDRTTDQMSSHEQEFVHRVLRQSTLEPDKGTIRTLYLYLKENVRPILSFTREGV